MELKINRLTDILYRDDGISGAMSHTEQISWILFLKFLNDYENGKAEDTLPDDKEYRYILDEAHRWDVWACPKKDGKLDISVIKSGSDLLEYVNGKLFPYLK